MLALKITRPGCVRIHRGNHEDALLSRVYDFSAEVRWLAVTPLGFVECPCGVPSMHGGVPSIRCAGPHGMVVALTGLDLVA